jgi:hypothetical protein
VQQVEQPLPAGQRDRGVEPGVHHPSRDAEQDGYAEHQPQAGRHGVPGVPDRGQRPGHGEQGGHAQAPDQRADERGDQHGPGRGDEQDQAQLAD